LGRTLFSFEQLRLQIMQHRPVLRFLCGLTLPLTLGNAALQESATPLWQPRPEALSYDVEWRLVQAGQVTVKQTQAGSDWRFEMKLTSAGIVSRLFRVDDTYEATTTERFCGVNIHFDAQEGKKHSESQMAFDTSRRKLLYEERNVTKNTSVKRDLDIQPCTYDIVGALAEVRFAPPDLGRSVSLPVTDGKKFAIVEVEALNHERVTVAGKSYAAVKYEAFIFDDVLYKRKGRFFMWLADDADRLPVQFQVHTTFPIGNVTIALTHHE
jgi:hypothetical protein